MHVACCGVRGRRHSRVVVGYYSDQQFTFSPKVHTRTDLFSPLVVVCPILYLILFVSVCLVLSLVDLGYAILILQSMCKILKKKEEKENKQNLTFAKSELTAL